MNVIGTINEWISRLVPRAKDRRALGIGCIAMSSMTLVGRGIPAWQQWESEERLALEESSDRLSRARATIEAHRATTSMRRTLSLQLDSLSDAYLHAPSVAVAGAALATIVSDLGDESDVRVTSASVRPDTNSRTAFTRVAVRVSAMGDVEGLADLLRSIESSSQLLAVRELSVAQGDPSAPGSQAEALRFELLVEGLVRLETQPRRAAAR